MDDEIIPFILGNPIKSKNRKSTFKKYQLGLILRLVSVVFCVCGILRNFPSQQEFATEMCLQ